MRRLKEEAGGGGRTDQKPMNTFTACRTHSVRKTRVMMEMEPHPLTHKQLNDMLYVKDLPEVLSLRTLRKNRPKVLKIWLINGA